MGGKGGETCERERQSGMRMREVLKSSGGPREDVCRIGDVQESVWMGSMWN